MRKLLLAGVSFLALVGIVLPLTAACTGGKGEDAAQTEDCYAIKAALKLDEIILDACSTCPEEFATEPCDDWKDLHETFMGVWLSECEGVELKPHRSGLMAQDCALVDDTLGPMSIPCDERLTERFVDWSLTHCE